MKHVIYAWHCKRQLSENRVSVGKGWEAHTNSRVVVVEIEEVFILDLAHLDDGLILHAVLVSLHLGPDQLVSLVGMEPLPHGHPDRPQLMPACQYPI